MKTTKKVVRNFIESNANERIVLYEEFMGKALDRIEKSIGKFLFWDENVQVLILKDLVSQMDKIAVRTFIAECQEQNYCRTEMGRKSFFQKYPVLYRCLQETMFRSIEFYVEMLVRLAKDKEKIEQQLLNGKEFYSIRSFDKEKADMHFLGKRVVSITLDCGEKIVYKPHSIENEQWFDNFVKWLGGSCEIEMNSLKRILKENYGWAEYVTYEECKNEEEVKRYFTRIGTLMFASYLLGTHDIHCENLIAHGEYPVVIDLENLASAVRKQTSYKEHKAKWYFRESVLMSGILPYYHWNKSGNGVDLSALTGGENERMPFRMPVIKNQNCEKIKIEYEHPVICTNKNRVRMNGENIEVQLYEKEIVNAFKRAYHYVYKHREMTEKKLGEIAGYKGRYLVADTQKYSMLLLASYHSSVMKRNGDREELLRYALMKNRKDRSTESQMLCSEEIKDLMNNDIPYFYFQMNESNLYTSRGICIKNFFEQTPFETCLQKVKRMSRKDMDQQVRWIYISLNPDRRESVEPNLREVFDAVRKPDFFPKEKLLDFAERIAEKLLNEAVYDEEYGTYHWFRMLVLGKKSGAVAVTESGMYLYDGIAGICLFFHMLYALRQENRVYEQVCTILDKQLYIYTEKLVKSREVERKQSGIYNGEGSLVYTYLKIYSLTSEQKYLDYAKKHASCLWDVVKQDMKNDLLDGKAGALAVFSLLYQKCLDEKYFIYAKKTAELLLKESIKVELGIGWKYSEDVPPLLGMAHGNAGMIAAFSVLKKIAKTDEYDVSLWKMLKYENSGLNKITGDWFDYRAGKQEAEKVNLPEPAAWCYGAGGILISRMVLKEALEEQENMTKISLELEKICKEDIERAISYLKKHKEREDVSLCHGLCGNLLIERFYDRVNKKSMCQSEEKFLEVQEAESIKWKEWYQPGLMNGYVGIGYYFCVDILSKMC